jgi:hypothetical protein
MDRGAVLWRSRVKKVADVFQDTFLRPTVRHNGRDWLCRPGHGRLSLAARVEKDRTLHLPTPHPDAD